MGEQLERWAGEVGQTVELVFNMASELLCPRCGCPNHKTFTLEQHKQWKECNYCGINFDKKEIN
jgi:hypothetical protein